jgi:hypothetical protein
MPYNDLDDKSKRAKHLAAAKTRAKQGTPLTENESDKIRLVHIIFTVFCAISSVVAFTVVATSPEKSTMRMLTATDYRNNATALDTDFYPQPTFDLSRVINLGFVAAAISGGAALANVIGWIWRQQQVDQMAGGSNPYLWASFILWHPIIFLLVASLSGVTNVFLFSFICLTVLGWIFLLWLADYTNSYTFVYSQRKAAMAMNGTMGWSWLPIGFVFVLALSTYIMLAIYAFTTFGADAFSENAVSSGWYITIVAVHLVLYLVNPLVFVAWKAGWITMIYTREMIYHIFNGLFAIAATWLTISLFLADSVVLPPLP